MRRTLLAFVAWLAVATSFAASDSELGNIDFPTSGDAAAQPAFIEGVKALHSFQFDEAGLAFRRAQEDDPDFAMAYWGEAMSVNKPLWRIQDTAAARATLERLAPDLEGRLAKAATDKEKAWLQAADLLFYGPEDKLERDTAYARAMQGMHERWPDDHEIAVFHALSILGTRRPGDSGFGKQARAAAISLEVFDENPHHPGAAHFVIHSFDDPEHAILALPAARVYADIAPDSAHALHMPSHIFLQLGMWQEVVKSNTEAYRSAFALNQRLKLPEGREDFHALSWLAYGNLMLGNIAAADDNLRLAREALERNPGDKRVENGYLLMRARHLLETGELPALSLPSADSNAGMHADWISTIGQIAARRGDLTTAGFALERLGLLAEAATAAGETWSATLIGTLHSQLQALRQQAAGDTGAAIAAALAATEKEAALGAPSGPPQPIKPSWELYGEILLEAGRFDEAAAVYQKSLEWIPGRTPSRLGLARAAAFAGNADVALSQYRSIAETPGLHAESVALREASSHLD